MGAIRLYFIALVIICAIGFYKKWNALGKMILITYTFIALVAIWVPERGKLMYVDALDSSLVSYPLVIFMIIAYILFFSPFLRENKHFNVSCFRFSVTGNYTFFAKVFILCTFITIVLYSRQVIGLLQGGDLVANRLAMASDEAIYPYNNIVEKIIILFASYFQLLGLIVGFMMIKQKTHKKLGIITIALASMYEFCVDVYTSSRGMLAVYILLVLALYMFFYAEIDKGSKRLVNIVCIAVGVITIPYLVAVTVSRFSDQVVNSLVYYFGQPPYAFGLEVKSLNEFMHGNFAFGVLFGDVKFDESLGRWVRAFYTFLGWIYADWGFVGIIIIGFICALIFGKIIRKREFRMCDVYILFSYYKLLILGVFTIGRTRCYEIVITFAIYLFLRFVMDKYTFSIGNKKIH